MLNRLWGRGLGLVCLVRSVLRVLVAFVVGCFGSVRRWDLPVRRLTTVFRLLVL